MINRVLVTASGALVGADCGFSAYNDATSTANGALSTDTRAFMVTPTALSSILATFYAAVAAAQSVHITPAGSALPVTPTDTRAPPTFAAAGLAALATAPAVGFSVHFVAGVAGIAEGADAVTVAWEGVVVIAVTVAVSGCSVTG